MPRAQFKSTRRISVALCTFNAGRFLKPQLDSLLVQTRLPDELIVCDDRSEDDTVDTLKAFAETAPFPIEMRVNDARLGTTKNFEKAIGLARGDLIALADQDDVWHVHKLARIGSEFSGASSLELIFSDARLVDEDLHPLNASLWESIRFTRKEQTMVRTRRGFSVLLRHNVVTGATMAFTADLREHVLPIPDVWVHDGWIALVAAAAGNIYLIEESLIDYRQHGGAQIGAPVYGTAEGMRRGLRNRTQDFRNELTQFETARQQLRDIGVAPDRSRALDAKIRHLQTRLSLPRARALRIPKVATATLRGDYRRYARGWKDVAKDLIQAPEARSYRGPQE